MKQWIGTRVIVRSNDFAQPYMVATYEGPDPTTHNIPVVVSNGQRYWVMGIIVPHSPALQAWLDTLSNEQQWKELVTLKRFLTGNSKPHAGEQSYGPTIMTQ